MTKRNAIVSVIKDMLYYGFESFGRYYSVYRAFVANNQDPAGLQRLQLIIPEISQNQTYQYWAHPRNVWSGTNHGVQIIPLKGELIMVEFERGHPEVPIWSHGYFGMTDGVSEIPQDDADLKSTECYWFKTPYGHKIKIDDTKKSITISTPNSSITMQADGKFTIKNGNMDMATMLTNVMETYLKTTTVSGEPLSADSLKSGIQNMKDINQLFE